MGLCSEWDQTVLLLSCRRNERVRNFLLLLRQSQLFEVFVRERLEMYATLPGGPECSGEPRSSAAVHVTGGSIQFGQSA